MQTRNFLETKQFRAMVSIDDLWEVVHGLFKEHIIGLIKSKMVEIRHAILKINMTSFLSRVSILTRDIDIANLSVRLSVRYVPVSDENGLTYRHSFFHHTVAQSF